MNELFQTINASLMELVSSGVQLIPALLATIVIWLITRYSLQPVRRITRALARKN